jgi:hypothetical protein
VVYIEIAPPAAGLQNHLRSYATITATVGQTYISQSGGNTAPLRNMRLANTIRSRDLLGDSRYCIYRIPPSQDTRNTLNDLSSLIWMLVAWLIVAGAFVTLALLPGAYWIGYTNWALLPAWSIALRLIDQKCIHMAKNIPSQPLRHDSVIVLGRWNSCFILEGSREDINHWTGLGLAVNKSNTSTILGYLTRTTTLLVLTFVFISIPNGTVYDQVSFIVINILGQVNLKVGRYLNAKTCLRSTEKIKDVKAPTRTHLYGLLLPQFGNGEWVDRAGLLPNTSVWTLERLAEAGRRKRVGSERIVCKTCTRVLGG